MRLANRRIEEPNPVRDVTSWLTVGSAREFARKANAAIRRSNRRMMKRGLMRVISRGGEFDE